MAKKKDEEKKELTLEEQLAQIEEREKALADKEAALAEKEAALGSVEEREAKLAEGEKSLENGVQSLEERTKELESGQVELEKAQAQLAKDKKEYEKNLSVIANGEKPGEKKAIVVKKESDRSSMVQVRFVKDHTYFVGPKKKVGKKGEVALVPLAIANIFASRNVAHRTE